MNQRPTGLNVAKAITGFLPVQFAVPGGIERNILILLYVIAAIVVTVAAGVKNLSRTEAKQAQE